MLHLAIRLSLLSYSYVMMHGWRATLYAIMLQLVLVQCHKCVEGKPKIWPNWLEHDNCYIPMAVRHSVDLVRPYRIFKAIDKESSYYREEVEVVRVQWSISQIIHLKVVRMFWIQSDRRTFYSINTFAAVFLRSCPRGHDNLAAFVILQTLRYFFFDGVRRLLR